MKLNKKASLLFLISLILFFALSTLILPHIAHTSAEMFLYNALLVSIPALLLPALVYRRVNRFPIFRAPRFTHILLSLVLGFGCLQLNQALYCLNETIFFGIEIDSAATTAESLLDMSVLNMVLSLGVIPPLSEEFLMRGALLETWRRYSPIGAAVLTSLLFALMHLAPSAFIVYFGIGLLFAAVYLITRNVWLTVIVHLVNNMASVLTAISMKNSAGLSEAADESAEMFGDLFATRGGTFEMFVIYAALAALFIVPAILGLKSSCEKRRIGMYAPSDAPVLPEGEALEEPEEAYVEASEEAKGSMWRDAVLWTTIAVLVILNVIMGLSEFGVI